MPLSHTAPPAKRQSTALQPQELAITGVAHGYRPLPPRSIEGGTDGVLTAEATAAKRQTIAATLRADAAKLAGTAQMLRLAERHRVPRKAFLDSYMGSELDDTWLKRVAKVDKNFASVNGILAKYKTADGGFETYDKVKPNDRKALVGPVNTLAEDLSTLRGKLGLN